MTSGFVFLNRQGQRITARGVSAQLKKLAVRYGIDPDVVYPHSFRHRFAKSFLRCVPKLRHISKRYVAWAIA